MVPPIQVSIDGPTYLLCFWGTDRKEVSKDPFLLLLLSRSVVSNSLWPHELQHTRIPWPSPSPGAHSNSCPLNQWCHPTISSSVVPFFSCPVFPSIRVFSSESALHVRWPKYWSFSFSIILLMNIQSWFPLGLTNNFWYVILLFHFNSKYFVISFEPSFLVHR